MKKEQLFTKKHQILLRAAHKLFGVEKNSEKTLDFSFSKTSGFFTC